MADHPKHASSSHEILEVIRLRWSPRAFDPDRNVARADLLVLFEAARWAPSSSNEQPWRFVVADRARDSEAFGALLGALSPSNRAWAQYAPVLVLVATSTRLTSTGGANQSAWYDTGQAVGFLTLQATGLGLGVRQMEGFSREQARIACGVPDDFEPVVAMAIGYTGDPQLLASERHRLAERQPRTRNPAEDFVFEGVWGKKLGQNSLS
jgi:nitroreductase